MPTKKPTHNPHDSLGATVARLHAAMRQVFEKLLRPEGMTVGQCCVLFTVSTGKAVTPSQLASHLITDKGSVTRTVRELEARELVKRVPDKADRRSFALQITPRGKRLLEKLVKHSETVNSQFLASMNKAETKQFFDLALRMIKAAESSSSPSDQS